MGKQLQNILQKAGLLGHARKAYLKWMDLREVAELLVVLPILKKSGLLRRFYFAFFSSTFSAEMRQYIHGRYFYLKRSRGPVFNESLLRRNVHRLEKGLMAEERKPVFGLDFIGQTVQQFSASVAEAGPSDLNDWAFDILNEYFKIVGESPVIHDACQYFSSVVYTKSLPGQSKLPFVKLPPDADAFTHFQKLLNIRKSVRSFVPGSNPSRDQIQQGVRMAATAPSSCNRQPFRFIVLEDRESVVAVSKLAGGARSFAEGIPSLAVVVGSTSVSPSPGDRHLMYIDGSLASMNFMLALESMGVSSCPINWPDNKTPEKALRKIVALEKFERPVMLIAMGQAAGTGLVACSVRKGVPELLEFHQPKE
ncbi:nitroreductase family protein [Marinilabilia salmonicolor]|uniref:nitroreductase family protein n=1 Tax=Marinilabilia salmonicolor TaxID=989 RepID=UPI00029A9E75|nr:nitroreductase family protein [Marinilabilia salmonicolor]